MRLFVPLKRLQSATFWYIWVSFCCRLDDDFEDGNNVDSDWDPTSHNPTAVKFKDVEDDDELDREVKSDKTETNAPLLIENPGFIFDTIFPGQKGKCSPFVVLSLPYGLLANGTKHHEFSRGLIGLFSVPRVFTFDFIYRLCSWRTFWLWKCALCL